MAYAITSKWHDEAEIKADYDRSEALGAEIAAWLDAGAPEIVDAPKPVQQFTTWEVRYHWTGSYVERVTVEI